MYDLHHIARFVLHQIGDEHRIARHDQKESTSRGPSIRPLVASTPVRIQPIRGRGRGRVDWQVNWKREMVGEGEVVVKMVGKVVVEMVSEVVVHLSRHCHHYHPIPYLHPILL